MLDFIMAFMEASPGKYDVSCVRTLISVGVPTTQKTREKVVQLFDEGYIYIVGHKSDMIISGGMNIYSAEIKAVMISHPKIAEVAVSGVPNDQWGENVKEIVRLQPVQEETGEEVIAWCKEKMAGYRVPKSIDFVADFPQTAAGKVQKSLLRKTYWEGAGRKI